MKACTLNVDAYASPTAGLISTAHDSKFKHTTLNKPSMNLLEAKMWKTHDSLAKTLPLPLPQSPGMASGKRVAVSCSLVANGGCRLHDRPGLGIVLLFGVAHWHRIPYVLSAGGDSDVFPGSYQLRHT